MRASTNHPSGGHTTATAPTGTTAEKEPEPNAKREANDERSRSSLTEPKTEAHQIQPPSPTPKVALVTRLRGRVRDWQPRFLEMLRTTANVKLSCAAAGISRMTAYRERDRNVEFAKAFEEAIEDAVDLLHKAAYDRAVTGYQRPIFQGGVLVGYETVYSDKLTLELLRAHRPEMFNPHKTPPMKLAAPVRTQTPEEVLATVKRIVPLIQSLSSVLPQMPRSAT